MKKINHSTSPYMVYELKGVRFYILGCYGNTDTCRVKTSYHNLKPTAIITVCGKGIKIIQIVEECTVLSN
jgi:hypothetical protein